MKPLLTAEDWIEIYYALDSKLQSAVVKGSSRAQVAWRSHLRDLIKVIGPDGNNMYTRGDNE